MNKEKKYQQSLFLRIFLIKFHVSSKLKHFYFLVLYAEKLIFTDVQSFQITAPIFMFDFLYFGKFLFYKRLSSTFMEKRLLSNF